MSQQMLQHRSLREIISADLRDRILSKELQPGTKLDVPAIATAYGVSPGSVREAAIVLESEGLVIVSPRRGISVRILTSKDLLEIYAVRELIDTAAAEQLVRAGSGPLQALREAQERIDQAWEEKGFAAGLAADLDFHVMLSQLGDNSRLTAISINLADQTRLHLQPVEEVDDSIRARPPSRLHVDIVLAIASGDSGRIRRALADHYAFSRRRISADPLATDAL